MSALEEVIAILAEESEQRSKVERALATIRPALERAAALSGMSFHEAERGLRNLLLIEMKPRTTILGIGMSDTSMATAAALAMLADSGSRAYDCGSEERAKKFTKEMVTSWDMAAGESFTSIFMLRITRPKERHTLIKRPNRGDLLFSSFGTSRSQHKRKLSRFLRRHVKDKFTRKRCNLRTIAWPPIPDTDDASLGILMP